MNRRLYYLFPGQDEIHKAVNMLLIKRIDIHHMHVLAHEDAKLGDLPAANVFQKSDIKHSFFVGLVLGLSLIHI